MPKLFSTPDGSRYGGSNSAISVQAQRRRAMHGYSHSLESLSAAAECAGVSAGMRSAARSLCDEALMAV